MCLKEKESLAETLVNLQARRVDTVKYRNGAFVLILDILYLNKEPSITQWPVMETAMLRTLELSCNEMPLLAQKTTVTPD